jgi:hypothetical protein
MGISSTSKIYQGHFSQANLIARFQRDRLVRRDPLPVDCRAIHTVQVFKVNLTTFDDQTGMPPSNASFMTSKWIQVDIRENATDGVFAAEDNLLFSRWDGQRYLSLLDDQSAWN